MHADSEQAYSKLESMRAQTGWQNWPKEVRAILPQMARERTTAMLPVWYPPIVYIEPTNQCNANCIFCPRHKMTRPIGYMDIHFYEHLIRQISALGPSEIRLFHYGEPMLHPKLPKMIRIARDCKLTARFQTNGLRIDPDTIRQLLDAGMNYIGISVNGLTPEEYETIRPGLSFRQLVRNLHELRRLIDEVGATCHIHLNAHCSQEEVARREHDIQVFKTQWFHVADSLSVSGIRLYQGVHTLQDGQIKATDQIIPQRDSTETLQCTEPFDRLVIKWDGRVSPCCVDYDGQMIMGDATRQSIEEIWNSPSLLKMRHDFRHGDLQHWPLCAKCPKSYSKTYNKLFIRNVFAAADGAGVPVELV